MQTTYRNQYKRHDIFSCNHSAHHRFGGAVSTYYILEEKKCYPEGCINFIWRCHLLNKGHACPKKYQHVGRKCFSCKQFYEEKYCQQPSLMVAEKDYKQFLRDQEDFDFWISRLINREVQIDAQIVSIKPDLYMFQDRPRPRFRFNGWILVFNSVYIGYDLFDDTAFGWISDKTQKIFKFSSGDRFEAAGRFNFERGRLLFNRIHNIEKKDGVNNAPPDLSSIMVATETASLVPVQPEKCIRCPQGILIENEKSTQNKNQRRRNLICLKGIKNPAECLYHLAEKLRK